MFIRKRSLLVAYLFFYLLSSPAFGEDSINNYVPPSSPELYDKNEPIMPERLKLKSQPFLNVGLGFGQSFAPGGPNATTAWDASFGVGYMKPLGSWRFFSAQMDLMNGFIGHAKADMPVKFGALAKIGYGMNLGGDLFGTWLIGAGVVNAGYREEMATGEVFKASSDTLGSVWQGAYELFAPLNSSLAMTAGFYFSQYHFALGDLESDLSGFVAKGSKTVVLNHPEVKLGLRIGL